MARDDYDRLDDNEKVLTQQRGLFSFPEMTKGKTDHNLRKVLVFFFDDEDDYKIVLEKFDKRNTRVKSHPDLDGVALAEMIRRLPK